MRQELKFFNRVN
jgi:cation diffusion facilitator CzcD-associated flavoprotein CzcO